MVACRWFLASASSPRIAEQSATPPHLPPSPRPTAPHLKWFNKPARTSVCVCHEHTSYTYTHTEGKKTRTHFQFRPPVFRQIAARIAESGGSGGRMKNETGRLWNFPRPHSIARRQWRCQSVSVLSDRLVAPIETLRFEFVTCLSPR